jgi:DNA polymerase III epsilon subunit-like protein
MSTINEINLEFETSSKSTGKYLVFDLETTGLPVNRNAPPDDFNNWPYVIQLAWLLFDNEDKLIEHMDFYLKQKVEIPIAATNIHGITTAMMLEKGKGPREIYSIFKKAIDNTEHIVCHNIGFEIPVITCDFLRNDMQWDFPNKKMFCTMESGANFCKIQSYKYGGYKWPTLSELYQKCFFPDNIVKNISGIHNANTDAAMTAQCFFKLKELGVFYEESKKPM